MELKNIWVQDGNGVVMPNADCYVYDFGTTDDAVGIIDKDGNPLANPFKPDAFGLVQFQAPNGRYDFRAVEGIRDTTMTIQAADVVQLSADLAQGVQEAQNAAADAQQHADDLSDSVDDIDDLKTQALSPQDAIDITFGPTGSGADYEAPVSGAGYADTAMTSLLDSISLFKPSRQTSIAIDVLPGIYDFQGPILIDSPFMDRVTWRSAAAGNYTMNKFIDLVATADPNVYEMTLQFTSVNNVTVDGRIKIFRPNGTGDAIKLGGAHRVKSVDGANKRAVLEVYDPNAALDVGVTEDDQFGDGVTTSFVHALPHTWSGQIVVLMDGVVVDHTYDDATHISINPAPANGAAIKIRKLNTVLYPTASGQSPQPIYTIKPAVFRAVNFAGLKNDVHSWNGDGATIDFVHDMNIRFDTDTGAPLNMSLKVDGIETAYVTVDAQTIRIEPAPANATSIVYRQTQPTIHPYGEPDVALIEVYTHAGDWDDIALCGDADSFRLTGVSACIFRQNTSGIFREAISADHFKRNGFWGLHSVHARLEGVSVNAVGSNAFYARIATDFECFEAGAYGCGKGLISGLNSTVSASAFHAVNNGGDGAQVLQQSIVNAPNAVLTHNGGDGLLCQEGGYAGIEGAELTHNANHGYRRQQGAFVLVDEQTDLTNNQDGAFYDPDDMEWRVHFAQATGGGYVLFQHASNPIDIAVDYDTGDLMTLLSTSMTINDEGRYAMEFEITAAAGDDLVVDIERYDGAWGLWRRFTIPAEESRTHKIEFEADASDDFRINVTAGDVSPGADMGFFRVKRLDG